MASLLRRNCSLAPARRVFSTSTPRLASLQWDRNNSDALADTIPEYPHGPPTIYKQSRQGLYGGQRIRFGNNVSTKGKNKSRRSWRPNIQNKRLFSKALNRHVQVRVSARTLRTIDKLGGLDEYLLGEKETRIRELGESGWWLRWAIMQTPTVKKRFAAEREALGLPAQSKELSIEEADAEAVLEASTPDAEVAELTLEENADPNVEAEPLVSAVLAEDDAFQIEQSKNLPPLRFRVGRNQHIELTEQGWRNVKSKSQEAAREEAAKQRIRRDWQHVRDKVMSYEMKDLSSKVLEEVLKRHAPTHTVTGMKERRSTAGRTVMEEQTWQEPIPNFQETKSFKRALSDLEGMIQRKREQAWRDAVNDKHSRRTANIANRKAERQEKARAIAVPVDAVPA